MKTGAYRTLHDLPFAGLVQELTASGLSSTHARPLWRALHRDAALSLDPAREEFLPPLRRWLKANPPLLDRPELEAETASGDGLTRKYLLRLEDGQTIETVLMGYPGRYTACVSTQAGCAMGCVFCATGQMGFVRHLRPGEIVSQILHVQRELRAMGETELRNLVLMGMGEPLHNYEAVMTALGIISDTRGINLGPSRITISTVGVVPGIIRMAEEQQPYHLAVSLHGATEEDRARLVPIAQRWPLAELMEACRRYVAATERKIFFEWTLIAGVNDGAEHAGQVAALLSGLKAHVNLIPLNPTAGFAGETSRRASAFQAVLREAQIPSTVRQRRGIDVAAGCGQLRTERERAKA